MTESTRRFARGAGWLYAYRWLDRLLDFVAIVVLARILSPDDFGLVAIAASVGTIIEGLAAFDVDKALIRTRDEARALFDTAWTLAVLRGLLSALVMLGITPFLDDARIGAILCALALTPILRGLANPKFVTYERDLVYSKLATQTLVAKIGSFSLTVLVALATRSYWALVLGQIFGALLVLVLSYGLKPFMPRLSLARFREIFGFSGWLSLTTIVTTLSMETDKLIVGRLLGVADAGLYFMTQRIGVLPTRELISPLQRLLFPSFSGLVPEPDRLRRVARESINVLGSLSLPAGVGFALVAADFVPLALGEQWLAIVPLLEVLVPYLGLRATLSMALPCVMALGRTKLLFWVSLLYAFVHLPCFIGGTALFGLPGAIWSIVLAGVFYILLNAFLLQRTLDIGLGEILGQLRRPLAATGFMVAAVSSLTAFAPLGLSPPRGSWTSLVARIAVGGSVFLVSQYLLWRLEGRPEGFERRLRQLLSR